MTHIGFTGTSRGMSDEQKTKIRRVLRNLRGTWFHHGDCVGADYEAGLIAIELGYKIHLHPPIDTRARAYAEHDLASTAREYLKRNHDIVDASELLLATPRSGVEQVRSGTWATVRYAHKIGKIVKIII